MKRKSYERPTTEVANVQQLQMLMASGKSEIGGRRSSYETAEEQTWD
jgi:hypothetical protein